jgi:hypothetical protein
MTLAHCAQDELREQTLTDVGIVEERPQDVLQERFEWHARHAAAEGEDDAARTQPYRRGMQPMRHNWRRTSR